MQGYTLSSKIRKISIFSAENFQILKLKKSLFIAWTSFRNGRGEIAISGLTLLAYYIHVAKPIWFITYMYMPIGSLFSCMVKFKFIT